MDTLYQVWLQLALEKKIKMWKVYDNNDDNNDNDDNDNDGQLTNFDQKRSLEPLAQVSSEGLIATKVYQNVTYLVIQYFCDRWW